MIGYLALAVFITMAVHECGHVIAARLVGYDWDHIIIGPIQVSRNDGSIRVTYSGSVFSDGAVIPSQEFATASRLRRSIVIAGGPLASLAFGAIILVLFFHRPFEMQNPYSFLRFTGFMSVGLGVLSIIPLGGLRGPNDAILLLELWGRNSPWILYEKQMKRHDLLLDLYECSNNGISPRDWDAVKVKTAVILRDDSESEVLANEYAYCWACDQGLNDEARVYRGRLVVLSKLLGTGGSGELYAKEYARYAALTELHAAIPSSTRPRDWDSDIVMEALAIHDQSPDEALACYYAYAWALDHGRSKDAGDYLDKALDLREICSLDMQRNMMLEAAYLEAFIRENPSAARAWFDQAEPVDEVRLEYLISESAVLLAEGEKEEARAKAEEALADCKPERVFEREILEKILAKC